MNKKPNVVGLVALTWILMGIVGSPAFADSDRSRSGGFEKSIAGTYLVRESPDQTETFLRLITLTEDGNWFSVDSHQQSLGFTDQQGVWKRSGRREMTANVIDFDIAPGGNPTGVVRIRFVISFSKNFKNVTGSFFGEAFELKDYLDIFNPDAVPLSTFKSTFQGRRVTVDVDKKF